MMSTGSILGSLGQAVGIGSLTNSNAQMDMYNAMQQMSNQTQAGMERHIAKQHTFTFEEIENGWIIHHGGKKWMVSDLDELKERVVAVMVERKLEK